MDDERWMPGMPVLDRQSPAARLDVRGRPIGVNRVPETRPTPLQDAFIPISAVALVCGVVAITAFNLGSPLTAPVVRIPVLVGAALLALVGVDALVRVWRSAWAWLPVDRGRGLFRFVWAAVLAAILVVLALAAWLVLTAPPPPVR